MHPHSRAALRTLAAGYGHEIVEVGLRDGVTDPDAWAAAIDQDTSAVIFQQPNFLGAVEDAAALAGAAKDSPAVVVGSYDPIPLGILKPPGECGVDVAVGEGQTLGNRLDFGGPSFGFFAATEAYLRRMPGRIAGETRDVDGRRGFVLTLQTREQHIRREKATSNICTAQALNALAGVVYLTWLGRRGLVELGELLLQRTHYAREALTALDGVEALHEQPVVREFARAAATRRSTRVIARCQDAGVNPGFALGPRVRRAPRRPARRRHRAALQGRHRPPGRRPRRRGGRRAPDRGGGGMSATTETPLQREAATTIFEKGAPGRRAFSCPPMDVPEVDGPAARRRCAAPSRRACPRSQSPSSCATTSTSPSATSTSTRASIRSARAR